MPTNELKKITVLVPCHNEEVGIAHVMEEMPFDDLKRLGFRVEVIVIDNNSTDKTALVARAHGATVIHEPKKGKGNALSTGFRAVTEDTDFVVMIDGDNTYKPKEIARLVEPLACGFCDVVVGSRLGGKIKKGSLHFRNRVVNWGFAFLVRQFYKVNVTDVLSGFFAWKKDAIDIISAHLRSEGFSLEMELITKTAKLGLEMYSVPITYDVRDGKTKISPVRDGISILAMLAKNLFWKSTMAIKDGATAIAEHKKRLQDI
ncbi:MAG TPA: glycosyltransferase family 2 protein [Candidatus Paceibacterota bacterium]|nr:glycosyltransferase family 2 protein [Candidatus Paceibacterota bacterium]